MANVITNKGRMKIVRSLSPDETLRTSQIWASNGVGVPTATDTTAEFCDGTELAQLTIIQTIPSAQYMYYIAEAGFTEANFTWTKVGLVDEDGTLIAESEYTLTKTNTEEREITFNLEVTV